MDAEQKRKALTLGDLIESLCNAGGKRRPRGIVRLAAKARIIVFQK
jgi:hypothetical protein